MRINHEAATGFGVTLVSAPDLSVGKEEALLGGKAVDFLCSLFGVLTQDFLQGHISDLKSADIGDVFPLGQLAVEVLTRQGLVGGVLLDDLLGPLGEFPG